MGRQTKTTDKWIQQVRDSLLYLSSAKIDEVHREVMRRCMESELVLAIERFEESISTERDGTRWTEEENETLKNFLKSQPLPTTYHQEEDIMQTISLRLKRSRKHVEKEARKLGLGKHFDFWLNNPNGD